MSRMLAILKAVAHALRDWRLAVILACLGLCVAGLVLALSADPARVSLAVSSRRIPMSMCLSGLGSVSIMCLLLPRLASPAGPLRARPTVRRMVTLARLALALAVVCLPAGLVALVLFAVDPVPYPGPAVALLFVLLSGLLVGSLTGVAVRLWPMMAQLAEGADAQS